MDWEQETETIFTDATVLLVSDKPQAKQTSQLPGCQSRTYQSASTLQLVVNLPNERQCCGFATQRLTSNAFIRNGCCGHEKSFSPLLPVFLNQALRVMCRRTRVCDEALLCLHSIFGILMMCLISVSWLRCCLKQPWSWPTLCLRCSSLLS